MPALHLNQKVFLTIALLIGLVSSFAVTIISHNTLSDSISISISVLLTASIIAVLATVFLEILESICNP
ncbi:hypothetical protein EC844_101155 [Acinetobacter calcoaceticus]|uniref:Uncharacterized protein n=1 Tax=Acinetobacter calcoaceticus TaxID=471 RepID=A0A4R1Y5C6_ACICA|nr:hypothetical protein EC844_101155 [Acinetobacter calcoaceticus]